MNDPFNDSSWSDLAADLGIETPKPILSLEPPPLPEMPAEEPAPADLSDALFGEPLPDAEETGSDTEVIELGGTDEQKKRRRRRRRGKKKDGEAGETEAVEPADDGVTQPSDLLRDIIRNWDVPSWDEIVGGLYRPNR